MADREPSDAGADGLLARHLPEAYRRQLPLLDFLAHYEELFAGFDETIRGAYAHYAPRSTPARLLDWLGGWVGFVPDPTLSTASRRGLVDRSALRLDARGTPKGLRDHLVEALGLKPEQVLVGEGPVDTAPEADHFIVEIRVAASMTKDDVTLLGRQAIRIIETERPAHLSYELRVKTDPKLG
jgi:phage tail-like protein